MEYSDLFNVTLHGVDVQEFDSSWDEVLSSLRKILPNDILESLCKTRKRGSDQLRTVLAFFEVEMDQHNSEPRYKKLKTMVKKCMAQRVRAQKFEARNGRIETRAPAKDRSKGMCYHLTAKRQCARGDACSFRHGEDKRGKSNPTVVCCFKTADFKAMAKRHGKEKLSEAGVRLGKDLEDRAKTASEEKCTNPLCDSWHSPSVKITLRNRDANSVKMRFDAQRLTISPTKNRKNCGECSVGTLKNSRQANFVFQEVDPPKSIRSYKEAQHFGSEAQRAILKRYITPRQNWRRRWSIIVV